MTTVAFHDPMYIIRSEEKMIRGIGGLEELLSVLRSLGVGAFKTNSHTLSQSLKQAIFEPNIEEDFSELEKYLKENPMPITTKKLKEIARFNDPEKNNLAVATEIFKIYSVASESPGEISTPPFFEELIRRGVFEEGRMIEDFLGIIDDIFAGGIDRSFPEIAVYETADLNRMAVYLAIVAAYFMREESEPPFLTQLREKGKISHGFLEFSKYMKEISPL